ncbi:sensor histidine kinase [Ruminococcus gauvreauii]|uniref:Sensor histidine kinase n=1 Tax=Ruminococcus gauvreauii TaxID=438033 RepID=A0ABY5VFP0_9FIRM|nr:histidine kinase [Ruminococcus gauvreauii]UWP58746.1 sensor histidine kinase [Ruminococcus gauvreauii]
MRRNTGGKRLSWVARTTLILICVILIPFLALTVILTNMAMNNMQEQTETLVEYKLEESSVFLENQLDNIYDILYHMVTDKQLLRSCDAMYNQHDVELAKSNMRERFLSFVQMDNYLISATYIGMHDEFYTYETYNAAQGESVWADDTFRTYILQNSLDQYEMQFVPVNFEKKIGNIGPRIYYITITLRDYVADEDIGVLALGLNQNFFECLEKGSKWDALFDGTIGVIDSSGHIIYSNDESAIDCQYDEWMEEKNDTAKNTLINTRELSTMPWHLCSVIDRKLVMNDIDRFMLLVIGLLVISMVLSVAGGYMVSRYFTKNLKMLAAGLKQFGEGKIGMQLPSAIEDEFYPVVVQFNEMSTSIQHLLEERKLQEEKTIDAIGRQRKAELRAVEMQINPHFLYNTLDAINWIAIENEQYKISEMLSSLASIFRYSISHIDMVVPVWAEAEWLEKYLFLQQQRFNSSFSYRITIPQEVEDLLLRKMILQPIVENAIIHGVAGVKEGHIEITFSLEGEILTIQVIDNGVGIDHTDDGGQKNDGRSHIGIGNVRDRLKSYYDTRASIQFEKNPGGGTIVTLKIPAIREET